MEYPKARYSLRNGKAEASCPVRISSLICGLMAADEAKRGPLAPLKITRSVYYYAK